MGIFNFFIVIPEIIASFIFGPVIRALFGADNPRAPLFVVMAGGVFMLVAALRASRSCATWPTATCRSAP